MEELRKNVRGERRGLFIVLSESLSNGIGFARVFSGPDRKMILSKDVLKSRRLFWALIILILVNAFWSSFVFLVFLKVPVYYWFFLNICAPTIYLTTAALLSKNKVFMNAMVPFLIYFGTGGLFLFNWSSIMLQAQFTHILMTITAIYIVLLSLDSKKKMLVGFTVGIIAILILTILVFPIVFSNPEVARIFEQMTS